MPKEIEFSTPEQTFGGDQIMIGMAKGQIPFMTNMVTVYCPRCHWGGSQPTDLAVHYCQYCQKDFN